MLAKIDITAEHASAVVQRKPERSVIQDSCEPAQVRLGIQSVIRAAAPRGYEQADAFVITKRPRCHTTQASGLTNRVFQVHHLWHFPQDRKSTRLELQSRFDLVCRLLLEKKTNRTGSH